MTVYISNAFTPKMTRGRVAAFIEPVSRECFLEACGVGHSIVGHWQMADLFGVDFNREAVTLEYGDVVYVCLPQFERDKPAYVFREDMKDYDYKRIEIRSW